MPWKKFATFFDQNPGHVVGHHHGCNGQIARRQSLGNGHQVRLDVVVVTAKPFAGSAESADDFISHQ